MFRLIILCLVSPFIFALDDPMKPDFIQAPVRVLPSTTNTQDKVIKPKQVEYLLTNISQVGDIRRAFINQKWLTINDEISGAIVQDIQERKVVLSINKKRKTIELQQGRATIQIVEPIKEIN